MYSTKYFGPEELPYAAMLLVEPPMIDRSVFQANLKDRQRQLKFVTAAVSKSRASWPDKTAAFEYFAKRPPWCSWDRRVLELYVVRNSREIRKSDGLTSSRSMVCIEYRAVRMSYRSALRLASLLPSSILKVPLLPRSR